MKNLFSLIALVGCFMVMSSSVVSAQDLYRNYTDCDFEVKVVYGDSNTCTVEGVISLIVPANGSGNVGIPASTEILYLKGRYVGTGCAFYVGQSACSPYDDVDEVDCSSACGDYIVAFNPSIGFKIGNN